MAGNREQELGSSFIDTVYCWANGMTMVFDQRGQQMFGYQGRTDEVMPKIRAAGWKGEPIHAVCTLNTVAYGSKEKA